MGSGPSWILSSVFSVEPPAAGKLSPIATASKRWMETLLSEITTNPTRVLDYTYKIWAKHVTANGLMMIDLENTVLKIGVALLTTGAVCEVVLCECKHIKQAWCRIHAPATSVMATQGAHACDTLQNDRTKGLQPGDTSPVHTSSSDAVRVVIRLTRRPRIPVWRE